MSAIEGRYRLTAQAVGVRYVGSLVCNDHTHETFEEAQDCILDSLRTGRPEGHERGRALRLRQARPVRLPRDVRDGWAALHPLPDASVPAPSLAHPAARPMITQAELERFAAIFLVFLAAISLGLNLVIAEAIGSARR